MISSLNNVILKEWLLQSSNFIPCNELTISTIGSQPFLEDDFDEYLRANGVLPYPLHEDTEVLIIGHEDWSEEAIKDLLDTREGQKLKVYSQEMFLAHWTTGLDPFENKGVLDAFAEGHPALEFLQTCWVDWVSTEVSLSTGNGNLALDASPEKSVLKDLGYTVGKTKGLPSFQRQSILEKAFKSDLLVILSREYTRYCKVNFPNYIQSWGEPNSPKRLAKMRDFISANCKQQKRKGNDKAASDYEEDLAWLDMCCRTGRFKFNMYKAYVG